MKKIIQEDVFENIYNKYKHILNTKKETNKLVNFDKFCVAMEKLKDKKIIILNDLDFDGFSCSYNLETCFRELGYDFDIHIGTRKNGYGINKKVLDKYIELGYNALVCADFGIQQKQEVEYAYSIGYETIIVIDHHTIIDSMIPDADCVINPKFNGKNYGYYSLSAGGVCYILMRDYYEYLGLDYDLYSDLLRMGAMSCIADMVDLKDSTWQMVRSGLSLMSEPMDKRLKKLLSQALKYKKKLGEQDISFSVAPIVGSVSRLSDPYEITVPFINGKTSKFEEMVALNVSRKELQKKVVAKAIEEISKGEIFDIIIYVAKDIPDGLCGLIASGITQHFRRPALVLNDRGAVYGGSGRSFGGFNLLECLSANTGSVLKSAGHSMALGVTIEKDKIDLVLKDPGILSYIELNKEKILVVDEYYEVAFQDIPRINELLSQFTPFGVGNPRPKFVTKYAKLDTYFKQGELTLIKLSNEIDSWGTFFDEPHVCIKALYFGEQELTYDDYYDIYFTIEDDDKIIVEEMIGSEL